MSVNLELKSLPIYEGIYEDPDVYIYLFVGGRGSGKTTEVVYQIFQQLMNEGGDFFVLRKKRDKTHFSVHKEFADLIHKKELTKFFKIRGNSIEKLSSTKPGKIAFEGAGSSKDLKSFSGFRAIWLEEADQFDEEDIQTLSPTIRKENAKLFMTTNLVSFRHWISKNYLQKFDEKVRVIKSSYLDNHHLPKNWLENQKLAFAGNELSYRIQVLGEELDFDLNKLIRSYEVVPISNLDPKVYSIFSVFATRGNNLALLKIRFDLYSKNFYIVDSATFSILDESALQDHFSKLDDFVITSEEQQNFQSLVLVRFKKKVGGIKKVSVFEVAPILYIWKLKIMEHENKQNLLNSFDNAEFITVDDYGLEQQNALTKQDLFIDAFLLALCLVSTGGK